MTDEELRRRLDAALAPLEVLDSERAAAALEPELAQRMLTVATRLYATANEACDGDLPPFVAPEGAPAVTATQAVTTAGEMLHALNIEVFELAMWQARRIG